LYAKVSLLARGFSFLYFSLKVHGKTMNKRIALLAGFYFSTLSAAAQNEHARWPKTLDEVVVTANRPIRERQGAQAKLLL